LSAVPESTAPRSEGSANPDVGGRYQRYLLGVLVLVYVLNFLDRQIITILAEDIKRDLGVSDAEIGFLYGTAFAVFYAIFGIPLGRLADVWSRRSLIARPAPRRLPSRCWRTPSRRDCGPRCSPSTRAASTSAQASAS
jgi:hypothetical protein